MELQRDIPRVRCRQISKGHKAILSSIQSQLARSIVQRIKNSRKLPQRTGCMLDRTKLQPPACDAKAHAGREAPGV